MTFDYPWLLVLALLLPAVAVAALAYANRRRHARLARLGDASVVERLVPATRRAAWHGTRLAGACALAGVALAGPRWGLEQTVNRSNGFDMVLALDASLSMMATDVKPDRLEQMKQEVRRLRALSPGDRIGLIVFAGRSYVLSPLTVDEGALDLFLDNLDPSIVGQPGSSLAAAIRQGTDLLSLGAGSADRALIVMSDGEAFEPEEDVVAAAQRARAQGVSLVTVGFGTEAGSTIPLVNADGSHSLKRDDSGQIVVTHYVPAMLSAAADAAHGTFIPADATDKAGRIRRALSTLRTQSRATLGRETRVPRYQLFLLPAVLLLLLDTFLADARARGERKPSGASDLSRHAGVAGAAALMLLLIYGCAGSRTSANAAKAYAAKSYASAAELYRQAITDGDQRPRTIYNYGTALLQLDSTESAADAYEHLTDLPDQELRYRAEFNLGLAHLKRGLDTTQLDGGTELDAALDAYRQVLLMHPADTDAKWNYELALRAQQSGGGGGGGGGQGGGSSTPQPQQDQTPQGGLSMEQANQLLASAAREERDVQARQQRKPTASLPPGFKDW